MSVMADRQFSYPIVGKTVTFYKNAKMSHVGQMSDKFVHFVAMADKKWTHCRMSAALGGAPSIKDVRPTRETSIVI